MLRIETRVNQDVNGLNGTKVFRSWFDGEYIVSESEEDHYTSVGLLGFRFPEKFGIRKWHWEIPKFIRSGFIDGNFPAGKTNLIDMIKNGTADSARFIPNYGISVHFQYVRNDGWTRKKDNPYPNLIHLWSCYMTHPRYRVKDRIDADNPARVFGKIILGNRSVFKIEDCVESTVKV